MFRQDYWRLWILGNNETFKLFNAVHFEWKVGYVHWKVSNNISNTNKIINFKFESQDVLTVNSMTCLSTETQSCRRRLRLIQEVDTFFCSSNSYLIHNYEYPEIPEFRQVGEGGSAKAGRLC